MIVISDTSPINYLLLINQIELLPRLFAQVIIPNVVRDEMLAAGAPPTLQQWIVHAPAWLGVETVSVMDETLSTLDQGEQATITLAQTLQADLVIIDERLGRQTARDRQLSVIGTLGILDEAAARGWINLREALAQLQQTNFRVSRRIVETLLHNRGNNQVN